jgi:hypothetical protein
MRVSAFVVVVGVILLMGCGGKSIAGKYHIEQDGAGFGAGAEKTELDLKADKTFEVKLGTLNLFSGTWSESQGEIKLSSSNETIAANYHLKDGKLIPSVAGKDITFWRWIPK